MLTHTGSSMGSFDANDMGLHFDVIQDSNFEYWAALSATSQTQQQNVNGHGNSSSNLTSPTHQEYSYSMDPMEVQPSFHMLPTPEGSENNGGAEIMMSPYDMMSTPVNVFTEDVFTEDELSFELEPAVLSGTAANLYNTTYLAGMPLSPMTSPNLEPDMAPNSVSRQNMNKTKTLAYSSSSARNHNRFTPLMKQKPVSSIRQKKQHNPATDSNMMLTSPTSLMVPTSIPLQMSPKVSISPMINKAPSPQDFMPNLNLGDNLISESQFSSSPQESPTSDPSKILAPNKIAPITPGSVMMLKKPKTHTSQKQSRQQKEHEQARQSQKILEKEMKHQMFVSSSLSSMGQQNQRNIVMTTPAATNPIGAQAMILISPGMTVSSGMTPSLGSAGTSRKTNRQNGSLHSPSLLPNSNSKSPQALKPTISPNLKPKLHGVLADEVAEQLAQKSNYQNILEGTAQSLGISYPSDLQSSLESRRTTHKAAEQKRRDSLKQSFDELKKVVLSGSSSSNSGDLNDGGKNDNAMKNVSKLYLLKRAHDHIIDLQEKNKEKDDMILKLIRELNTLKGKNGGDSTCEIDGIGDCNDLMTESDNCIAE